MAEQVKDWATDYDIFAREYIKDPFPIWDELREAKTGLKTPTRFWRCPDCRNRGFVFDGPKKPGRVDDRRLPPV